MTVDFSIIIPHHRDRIALKRLLDSIQIQSLPKNRFEVIVILNPANSDYRQTLDALLCQYDFTIRVDETPRAGVNLARNRGIEHAINPWLVFIDDDCHLPTDSWLLSAAKLISENSALGYGGRYRPWRSTLAGYAYWALLTSWLELYRLDRSRVTRLLGGCMILERNLVIRHQGFDASIVYGSAETEFILRLLPEVKSFVFSETLDLDHDFTIRPWHLWKKAVLQGIRYGRFQFEKTLRPGRRGFNPREEAKRLIESRLGRSTLRGSLSWWIYCSYIFIFNQSSRWHLRNLRLQAQKRAKNLSSTIEGSWINPNSVS